MGDVGETDRSDSEYVIDGGVCNRDVRGESFALVLAGVESWSGHGDILGVLLPLLLLFVSLSSLFGVIESDLFP